VSRQKVPMVLATLVGALLLAAPLYLTSSYYQGRLTDILIACISALALWILMVVGEISFGHAGFMCIGAYTVALLMKRSDISFWLALPAGGLIPAIVAFFIGTIGLRRVRGVYFFMFSLAVGESIRLVVLNWTGFTGGVEGIADIPRPDLFGFSFSSSASFYYLCLAIFLITLGIIFVTWQSRIGDLFRAIHSSEKLAAASGISPFAYRMEAWLMCCFFAGIAGGLGASHIRFTGPGEFVPLKSMYPLAHIIIGGQASPFAPLIGTTLMMLVSTVTMDIGGAPDWFEPLIYGLVLVGVRIGLRGGVWEFLGKLFSTSKVPVKG
jgi:branched-chain amino acid transport system permease protein